MKTIVSTKGNHEFLISSNMVFIGFATGLLNCQFTA